ncbi:MAG: extracellular solute-binding protein [Anaerolineales bacterium]|nr:extracellular solute-binding protein [Anaerolineales bacterium]
MKKYSILLIILLGLGLILVACGGQTEEAPTAEAAPSVEEAAPAVEEAPTAEEAAPADEEKTISFLSGQDENTGYTKIILELTNEWLEDNPNVTLEFEYYAQTDLQGRTQQLAAAGALPTLFPNPANETLDQMYENGQLVDIEAAFKEIGIWDQLNPGAVSLLKSKEVDPNALYELPVELNIEGFWYNKQIFADNGIEVPTTWDELLAASATLQEAGIQPFSASGQQGWPLTRLLGGYAVRNYGIDAMSRVANGDLSLTDPGFVEAADTLKMMADEGYFGQGLTTIDYNTAVDLFLQGEAAMFYMGSWELRNFNNPEVNLIGAENVGFFNVPMVEGGAGSVNDWSMNAGLTLAINSEHYDPIVADWLNYVFSNYGDRSMSELGAITGFKVNNMPEDIPPLTQMTLEQIASAEAGYLWWEALFNAVGNQSSTDLVQTLVSDPGFTGEQYMTDLQSALDQQ